MSDRLFLTATQHLLPFRELSWEQFERLCYRLAETWGYQQIEHLGGSGHEGGRDLVACKRGNRVAIQCKRVQTFSAKDGKREISKILALSKSSRPNRIVFIVTCNISSTARDQIRREWGGKKSSCQFVGAAELDAEVRRTPSILFEFFQVPTAITIVPTQRSNSGSEPISYNPAELGRIETMNQGWVMTTRSFHFQRLLQTIAELEYPAGRLEVNRALHHALRKNGAFSSPTGTTLLKVCDELDSNNLFRLNWKLRRMLARVVADVIGIQLGTSYSRVVGAFSEQRMSTADGILLLAEAASEHTAAAAVIGEPVLRRLLLSRQIQAPWQLLRRWPLVSPVLSADVTPDDIMNITNKSIRRLLFVIQLKSVRDSNQDLRNLLASVAESVDAGSGDPGAERFRNALITWAALYTAVDASDRRLWKGPFTGIREILHAASSSRQIADDLIMDIANALELDSLERDLRNADGGYAPHPERYSEGRYGYTRHFVHQALSILPGDRVGSLITQLLHSADEGIRWAVATDILQWWTLIPDVDVAKAAVLRLVRDPHPWVVRETLQQLTMDPYLCQVIGANRLAMEASQSKQRAEQEGWIIDELDAPMQRIGGLEPRRFNNES